MNVMQLVSGTAVNGAAVACLEITRGLVECGHRMMVVCRPGAWIAEKLVGEDVEVVPCQMHRWPPHDLRFIGRLARQRQIDVIQTHMSRAHFFGVLLRHLYGIPCVATAHSRHVQLHWMFNDRVVAVSESARRFHRRYNLVRSSRIEVIHNFVDDSRYDRVSPAARTLVRQEFAIALDARVVCVVGDVIPRKGMLYLVRALPEIAAAVGDVHVLSVGYALGEYPRQVIAEADRLQVADRLTLAGPRTDIDQILAAADVFALPSLEDTLPLAILEAMASGLPVVSTTVGGIPDCVIDGQTGRLVPPSDSARLARALIQVLSDADLRDRWGQASRQRIHRDFSRHSQIARWEHVLRRVAA